MKLEEAIDTLKNKICDYVIPNYCKDCANKPECLDDCNFILSIYTVLQEIEHLQKENEELKEHNRKYLEAEIFSAKQLKEIEKQRKEHYIDKGTLANIISRKRIYIPEYMGEFIARDDIENLLG